MNNRGFISFGLIFAFIALAVLGGAFYLAHRNQSVAPINVVPKNNTTAAAQQSGRVHFLTSVNVTHPADDWLAIGASENADITGWSVRSMQSGKNFTIGTIRSSVGGERTLRVIVGEDVAAFIHTVGSPTKNYSAENEYHLYFGESSVAWGKTHDAIQLVNPAGEIVDTYTY